MESFNLINKEAISHFLVNFLRQDYPENIVNRVFNEMLWSATADFDRKDSHKYKLPFWSTNAIEAYNNNELNEIKHEHMYPKRLLKEEIMNLNNNDLLEQNVLALLCNYAHAACITRTEDGILRGYGLNQQIPENIENYTPIEKLFSRYSMAHIELRIVRFENGLNEIGLLLDEQGIHNNINNLYFENGNAYLRN